jgi:hypothetical protein
MNTLDRLAKELEDNFIFELQNIVMWDAHVQYFSDHTVCKFLQDGLQAVNDALDSHYDFRDDLPDSIEHLILLHAAHHSVRKVIDDVNIGTEKAVTLLGFVDKDKELRSMSEASCDCFDMFEESLSYISTRMGEVAKYEVPKVGEDETLIVKVGNENRPASESDMMSITSTFNKATKIAAEKNEQVNIVTHHCLSFVVVKTNDLEKCVVEAVRN